MYPCLSIPEIVRHICSFISDEDDPEESGQYNDLVALLRTCRALYEPTLPFVWPEIPNLTPLLKCMPQDLWRIEGKNFEFSRELRTTDWPRFEMHARLVRRIVSKRHPIHLPPPALSVYCSLQVATGGRPLLPNIRSLTGASKQFYRTDYIPFYPLLMGPKLRSIRVFPPRGGDPTPWRSFVSNLPRLCPSLEDVRIEAKLGSNESMAVSTAVMGLTRLRSLSVGSISTEAFVHLTQLPTLSCLTVYSFDIDIPSATLPSPAFQSLTSLIMNGINLDQCIWILKLMTPALNLQSLSIESLERPVYEIVQFRELLRTISAACSANCLRSLYIRDRFIGQASQTDFATPGLQVTSNDIAPLLKFANLRDLYLSNYHGFTLDDDCAKDMAISWPHLESLCCRSSSWPIQDLTLPLSSLKHFAQYTQRLSMLSITLNVEAVSNTSDELKISNYTLRDLDVAFSHISDGAVPSAAAFLSDIFPNLDSLEYFYKHDDFESVGEEEPDSKKRWRLVDTLTQTIAVAREQEIR